MTSKRIEEWVKRRLQASPSPDEIQLRHASEESGESEVVERVKVPTGSPDAFARDVGKLFWDVANDHAEAYPGMPQVYKLIARVGGKTEGTYKFRARADGKMMPFASQDIGASEPPTDKGVLVQLMRHNEALMRLALEASTHAQDRLQRENIALHAERERDTDRRLESYRLFEDLQSKDMERRLMVSKHEAEQKRKEMLFGKVITDVLPGVVRALPDVAKAIGISAPGAEQEGDLARDLRVTMSALGPDGVVELAKNMPPEAREAMQRIIASLYGDIASGAAAAAEAEEPVVEVVSEPEGKSDSPGKRSPKGRATH